VPVPEPEPDPIPAPSGMPPAEPVEPLEPVAPVAEPVEPVAAASTGDARATRNCAMCGQRVPVDADGLHCYLGHALSPAHAEPPRRGFLRRLFGR